MFKRIKLWWIRRKLRSFADVIAAEKIIIVRRRILGKHLYYCASESGQVDPNLKSEFDTLHVNNNRVVAFYRFIGKYSFEYRLIHRLTFENIYNLYKDGQILWHEVTDYYFEGRILSEQGYTELLTKRLK